MIDTLAYIIATHAHVVGQEDVAQQEVDSLDDDCGDVHLSVVFFPQIGYLVSIPRAQSQHGSSSLGVPVHFRSRALSAPPLDAAFSFLFVCSLCLCVCSEVTVTL